MSDIISIQALQRLAGQWLGEGKRVAGPSRVGDGRVFYIPLVAAEQLALEGFIRPENSIKEFIFPRCEKLYGYHYDGPQVELIDWDAPGGERVILGARPCDAAALPILDHVFNWDYKDEFWNRRRAATTVVTLGCSAHDENCFCTSVGLGPAAERGSDAMLLPLGEGQFELRCLTDKGRALFAGASEKSERAAAIPAGPEPRCDPAQIRKFLENNFDSPLWNEASLRCLGCGACAYACPTCHCFDMVDEGTAAGGCRLKNWDSCQFGTFTLHASGHNPRRDQAQRQRQRLQHKFRIYPEKFGELLCTGCGNCTRNCPVGLGVMSVLEKISGME